MSSGTSASIVLVNQRKEIGRLSEFVERFGTDHQLSDGEILDVNLVLDEIVMNVIQHGYDDDDEHEIQVRFALDKTQLTIEVEDDGRPFNPLDHPAPNLDLPIEARGIGGLGVHIVRSLTDSIDHRLVGGRNLVTLRKKVRLG